MIHRMFIIYDKKAGIYNKPFFFVNEHVAQRAAQELIDNGDSQIAQHPEDFTMFEIGEYDDVEGKITEWTNKLPLVEFHHLRPRQKQMFDQEELLPAESAMQQMQKPNGAAMADALNPDQEAQK